MALGWGGWAQAQSSKCTCVGACACKCVSVCVRAPCHRMFAQLVCEGDPTGVLRNRSEGLGPLVQTRGVSIAKCGGFSLCVYQLEVNLRHGIL